MGGGAGAACGDRGVVLDGARLMRWNLSAAVLDGASLMFADLRSADLSGASLRNARLMLRHFGLEPDKDVKLSPGGLPESRLARLQQGLIDATVVPVPLDFRAKKMGLNVLARAYELFTYPGSGLVTTTKKIKEKPDEIKRVIRAGIKSSRYIKSNRDGTIQFLMDWQKIDSEIATATYEYLSKASNDDGSLPEKGFRLLVEETKELAKVNREVAMSDLADLSILAVAQKELAIKGK